LFFVPKDFIPQLPKRLKRPCLFSAMVQTVPSAC
jgi:hypothetical protein